MKERNGKPNKRCTLWLALALLFLTGCAAAVTESEESPPPSPTPVVTAAPTPTPRPTATPTPTPFVTLCGQSFYRKKELLDFSGRETMTESELREIAENTDAFPCLQTVRLPADPEDPAPYISLMQELAARGIDTEWEFRLYGATVCSTDTEIDLTKRRIPDIGAAAEEAAEWMPYLEKIDMSGCGLTDETMDKINKRHETVRFVWTVYFSAFSLRTDSTNFIAARTYNKAPLTSYDMRILRYCPDLIALDLGHKDITDLSFLYDVPNLRYLILVENDIRDITPIGSLKDLEYLELFWTKVEDPSPLIQCTKLLDLNICYIYTKADKAMEVLTQMPWLERLWYCGSGLSEEQKTALQEALPECEMYLLPHAESTGGGWREHPRYFEMRDVFEMYYMPGGTNGVAEDGSQIVLKG